MNRSNPTLLALATAVVALLSLTAGKTPAQGPESIRSDSQADRSLRMVDAVSRGPDRGITLTGRLAGGDPVVLRMDLLTGHIARVRADLDGRFEPTLQERDGFINTEWPRTEFSLEETPTQVTLGAPGITLRVERDPLRLSFYQGDRLLTQTIPGESRIGREQALLTMASPADEKFLGFGDQGSRHSVAFPPDRAPLDHRGRQLLMAGLGSNRIYYTPFFLSSEGYGLFLNTLVQSDWDMAATEPDRYAIQIEEPRLDFWVIAGPSFEEIIDRYTDIVGKPAMLPTWTMGEAIRPQLFGKRVEGPEARAGALVQGATSPQRSEGAIMDSGMGVRWFDQEEMLAKAVRTREEDEPADYAYIDSAWQTVRNSFDWVAQIPDPAAMIDSLNAMNFEVVLWQRSTPVKDDYPLWHEAVEKGYLVKGPDGEPFISPKYGGPSGLVDFTNPDAVRWWQQRQSEVGRLGVGSYKLDSAGSAFIESHPEALELRFHNGMTGRELDNYYGPLYLKTVWDGLKKDLAGERPVLFTYHSAYFAGGRYPFMALGDRVNKSTRDLQIRYALNYGLSGIPFWEGGDVSSLAVPMVPQDLRIRLRPYTYAAWRAAHETGLPVVRAMVFEDQDDPEMYQADAQFLFGNDLLVAPLVKGSDQWRPSFFPEEGPETQRVGHRYVLGQLDWQRVYIPEGEWIHYWSQKKYRGPAWQYFRPEDGLETLLVRGGAILPLGPIVEYEGQKPADPLTLEVYPYGVSSFRLYEDDGESTAYETGAYATTAFTSRETAGGIELEIGRTRGEYAGKPPTRTYVLQIRGTTRPTSVRVGARELHEIPTAAEWEAAAGETFESAPALDQGRGGPGWEGEDAGWYYDFENGYDRTVFVRIPHLPAGQGITVTLDGASVVRYYVD